MISVAKRNSTPEMGMGGPFETHAAGVLVLLRLVGAEHGGDDATGRPQAVAELARRVAPDADVDEAEPGECSTVPFWISVAFWHFNWRIEMQIEAQMRRTVIPHLKPILNTSELKVEMQFEMKWYIFLSVQQLRQIAALKCQLR